MLQNAAQPALGKPVAIDAETLHRALDPEHFVAVRAGLGGVAPKSTAALLQAEENRLDADAIWLDTATSRLDAAQQARAEAMAAY